MKSGGDAGSEKPLISDFESSTEYFSAPNDTVGNLYKLTFQHRDKYLYAFVEGDHDSYEISAAFWKEILNESMRVGAAKILVEEDLGEIISMSEMYNLGSDMASLGFTGICVAFVDRQAHHFESNLFGELVASNRGMLFRNFSSVQEAETWLLSQ